MVLVTPAHLLNKTFESLSIKSQVILWTTDESENGGNLEELNETLRNIKTEKNCT